MPSFIAPSGRWGHSFTAVSRQQAIMFGGQGEGHELCKDYLWLYDRESEERWQQLETTGPQPPSRMGHTAVYWEVWEGVFPFEAWGCSTTSCVTCVTRSRLKTR